MQQKIIIDTNIYIDIFNRGLQKNLHNPLKYVVFLAHPVLHELWMGARGKWEIKHLSEFQNRFVQLKRIVVPTVATLIAIGQACQKLRKSGRLDPTHPKHYNDISIAALARQVGATVITQNIRDFKTIQKVIDFEFERQP
ncbi:MAG: PIN domain-containing protein [Desulfobacterales bacterium]|nr:PIN domain-containing protein [Desulfobacterales bacterium]